MRYRVELEMLSQEAEIFRKSPVTAMTEKHFVVKRFFVAMVSRARDIFFQARQEVDAWLSTALEPLTFQIREHKEQMERRLQDLQKDKKIIANVVLLENKWLKPVAMSDNLVSLGLYARQKDPGGV